MASLTPVFSGWTEDNENIILYQHMDRPDEIHIQRPDGELLALSPKAEITFAFTWNAQSETDKTWVNIESPEWTGEATGSRRDLIEVGSR